ncbi:MAG TPA: universal stress protein [Syntrophales bacterium]|nr:universal stress protein [Syntrophales bacterium]
MEIKKILLATDFMSGALHATPYAADLALRYGAKLYILHVIQDIGKMTEWYAPKVNLRELRKAMEERSKQELQQCCTIGLGGYKNVEYSLLVGTPDEEIVKFQKDNNIDLIVIGANNRKTADDRQILGSTADRVVKFATCPVLTVMPTGEEISESTDPKLCSDGEIRF